MTRRHDFDWFHCSRIMRDKAAAWPCPTQAIVVYEMPDGTRAGWCIEHRLEADEHARARGWARVAQEAVAA